MASNKIHMPSGNPFNPNFLREQQPAANDNSGPAKFALRRAADGVLHTPFDQAVADLAKRKGLAYDVAQRELYKSQPGLWNESETFKAALHSTAARQLFTPAQRAAWAAMERGYAELMSVADAGGVNNTPAVGGEPDMTKTTRKALEGIVALLTPQQLRAVLLTGLSVGELQTALTNAGIDTSSVNAALRVLDARNKATATAPTATRDVPTDGLQSRQGFVALADKILAEQFGGDQKHYGDAMRLAGQQKPELMRAYLNAAPTDGADGDATIVA